MEPLSAKKAEWAHVNKQGDIVIPREVAAQYGLTPGSRVRLENDLNHVRLHRPVTHLVKVYVEPTVCCNLDCRTCIRNVWDEPMGLMQWEVFECILEGIQSFSPMPTVFLVLSGAERLDPSR